MDAPCVALVPVTRLPQDVSVMARVLVRCSAARHSGALNAIRVSGQDPRDDGPNCRSRAENAQRFGRARMGTGHSARARPQSLADLHLEAPQSRTTAAG